MKTIPSLTIDLTSWSDEFIVHYGGQLHQINTNTFANSLLSIGQSIQEINAGIDSNYDVEIHIEALAAGSFNAKLKLKPKSKAPLLTRGTRDNILLGATLVQTLLAFLSFRQNGLPNPQNIVIKDNKAYINTVVGENKGTIVLPLGVYESTVNLYSNNQKLHDEISKNFETLRDDSSIEAFGISDDLACHNFGYYSKSNQFKDMASKVQVENDENTKIVIKEADVGVIKIILEKSDRKWDFVWNGIKISASIKDDAFFEKMAKGEKFSQGDIFHVIMNIKQIYDPYSKVWLNDSYEISKIINHIPSEESQQLPIDTGKE